LIWLATRWPGVPSRSQRSLNTCAAAEVDVERIVELADHYDEAAHTQEAYRWALLAADAADQAGGLRLQRGIADRGLWAQACADSRFGQPAVKLVHLEWCVAGLSRATTAHRAQPER
jgi:hypothetical protein